MNSRTRIGDHLKLIRNIRTTGTVAPSSRAMIKSLLSKFEFSKARCVVELGPGNGCITRELLRRLPEDAKLICLELNNDFVAQLNALEDPRLHVYNACASSITEIRAELGLDVDYVVSSLPLSIMEDLVVSSVIDAVASALKPGGRFVQYQYTLSNFEDIKPAFSEAKVRFTLRNIPPAFIYDCVK
ncbi:MAG: rRNA adenine N-6-methyltransferase family protein [Pseudohongiellaceae bacterium]